MKEYIIKEGEGELLIHMTASNENYTISYDRGQLKFQNINKTYIIPKNLGHKVIYDKLDTLTNKNKYQVEDIRTLYRDTTPTDFGLSNKTNVSPNSKHTSEEIIVGGINDYIPVVAPEGVKIYVNGNIVGSGTMIYNGDRVKFELVAPSSNGSTVNYNLRVGDISKNVSIQTSNIVLPAFISTVGLDTTKFSYTHNGDGGYGFNGWRTPAVNGPIYDGVGDVWCRYYGNNTTVIYTPFTDSQIKITYVGFNYGSFTPSQIFYNDKSFESLGLNTGSIITLQQGYNIIYDNFGGVYTNTVGYTRIK